MRTYGNVLIGRPTVELVTCGESWVYKRHVLIDNQEGVLPLQGNITILPPFCDGSVLMLSSFEEKTC